MGEIIQEVSALMLECDVSYFYDVGALNRHKTEYSDALITACRLPEYADIQEHLKVGLFFISRFQHDVGKTPIFVSDTPHLSSIAIDPEQDIDAFKEEYLSKLNSLKDNKELRKSLEKSAMSEYEDYLRLVNGVAIRFFELIAKRTAIENITVGGFEEFRRANSLMDDEYNDSICKIDGAMSQKDIDAAVKIWEQKGLIIGKDMVVVQSMFGPQQEVDWLEFVIEGTFVGHMVIT